MKNHSAQSPIVNAILQAEQNTTGEIRVHLSKKWIERDPLRRATRLFRQFGMFRTTHRNAILLYVNLKRQKFAIIGDEGIHKVVGQRYWEQLAQDLKRALISTHPENAIAIAVGQVGVILQKHFPLDVGSQHHNELKDEFSED
jgi:uncharacterized membrane protein